MDKKTQILLTGASGTVGSEVLKQLYQQRNLFDITVFDVKTKACARAFSPYKNGIKIVYGDLARAQDIRKVCAEKDYVIHLAAIIPPLADKKPTLAHNVNVVGTENLVRNLEQLSPNAFLIYSSSVSVYGDRVDHPFISVEDPLNPSPGDEYAITKIKAEQIIRNSRLHWSIFRLNAVMGKHKLTELMFHMPLSTSLEIVTPQDTARAFILAMEQKPLIMQKIFNLGGGEHCRTTYQNFLTQSFQIFGLGTFYFPQKAFAEKNFHCGYYRDGDLLNDILHYRKDTLETYFSNVKKSISVVEKWGTSLFSAIIKRILLIKSEPYKAFIHQDQKSISQFFK